MFTGPDAESAEYNAHFYTFYILILSCHLCLRRPRTARLGNKYFNYWIAPRCPRATLVSRGKTQPSTSNISRNYQMCYIRLSHSEFFRYIRLEFDDLNYKRIQSHYFKKLNHTFCFCSGDTDASIIANTFILRGKYLPSSVSDPHFVVLHYEFFNTVVSFSFWVCMWEWGGGGISTLVPKSPKF